MANYSYHNRDISWLTFNYRVLEEAKDKSNPLFERIKFLAIYSNNLEEFYQVRVSYYRQLLKNAKQFPHKIKEIQPEELISDINEIVGKHQIEFHRIFDNEIIPELEQHNILLLDKEADLPPEIEAQVKDIFMTEILSSIQPVILIKKRVRPFLKSGHGYIVAQLQTSTSKEKFIGKQKTRYGLIKLPTDHNISRFIEIHFNGKYYVMFLEDAIMRHIKKIFPGYDLENWYSIKLTRDADLDYDEYEGDELIEAIQKIARSRSIGDPNRFLYDVSMPKHMLWYIMQTFSIDHAWLVKGGPYHNFRDFFSFPNPLSPELEHEKLPPIRIPTLDESRTIKEAVAREDFLLNPPYHSYDYFINFLTEASKDDSVTEIKATQYRVASRSAVVNALINAAENGKKVTVFVELKARFDEQNNLRYAREMKQAGINIIYSIPGLKVHAKLAMVVRENPEPGIPREQAFLATGNFNENTARIYGDHGLFTSHVGIINDLKILFGHLENQKVKTKFNHIFVPNMNLISNFGKLIGQEIRNAKRGRKAYILLKMNGLQDPNMVDLLYRASEAGVKIDLIIRGICILKTEQEFSKNIRVIRIVDRFLEHARAFVFHNNGKPLVYLGSADWMKRNLYRRIECIFPVYDEKLKQEIIDILNIQLRDNVKACEIDKHMQNVRIRNEEPKCQSQLETYYYLKEKYKKE